MRRQEWLSLIKKDPPKKEQQTGCNKCNHEGFIRDYDGTWLKDCECQK